MNYVLWTEHPSTPEAIWEEEKYVHVELFLKPR